jgi:hypothetical protein
MGREEILPTHTHLLTLKAQILRPAEGGAFIGSAVAGLRMTNQPPDGGLPYSRAIAWSSSPPSIMGRPEGSADGREEILPTRAHLLTLKAQILRPAEGGAFVGTGAADLSVTNGGPSCR